MFVHICKMDLQKYIEYLPKMGKNPQFGATIYSNLREHFDKYKGYQFMKRGFSFALCSTNLAIL